MIDRATHEHALDQIARLEHLIGSTRSRLLRFAQCTPIHGDADKTFAALKQQLRSLIADLSTTAPAPLDALRRGAAVGAEAAHAEVQAAACRDERPGKPSQRHRLS